MRRLTFLASNCCFKRLAQSTSQIQFFPVAKGYSTKILYDAAPLHTSNVAVTESASAPLRTLKENNREDISVQDSKGQAVKITPLNSFNELGNLPEWLRLSLKEMSFPSTTSIQKYAIPALEDGHDMVGLAPTGSGKTVAFAVPALKRMKPNADGLPSVLVLAPTRELVQQTTQVFRRLAHKEMRICEAYGGTPREIQHRSLQRGCDILIACPGRLTDFLKSGSISLQNLSFLVFDEADRLLDMGFQPQLDDILGYIKPGQKIQKVMWSATWPESVQSLVHEYLSDSRLLIRAGTSGTGLQVNEQIKQTILFAEGPHERIKMLVGLIDSGKIDENTAKLIIFVERQSDTENTARALSRALNIEPSYIGVIHGGLSQRHRDNVLNRFKTNQIRLLVATDVASRGLDIPDVTCVVNFQIPKNIDSYCHRIGRTGRAGRTGDAYTFVGREDGAISAELIEYLKRCNIEVPPQLVQLSETHNDNLRYRKRRSYNQNREHGFQKHSYTGRRESTGW
ncbi:unnamed protein product [Phytomonas sp. EM1]|nr:unnamed protein product [Phytomonas sp. EM1]|eukprot:CCW62289.1 unnamed protein product [Phytomonas sp. isolate EM1]